MIIKPKNKALRIAELAADKKASDIVILDLRKVLNFCDFFVIVTGTSKIHNKAIADGIFDGLRQEKEQVGHREGYAQAAWIVLDCSSVIVHVFDEETRNFYDLEHLWAAVEYISSE
ncbi:MAG: ribosome silencing factor [Candidatus Omnitrophota bacterium]